MLRLEDMWVVAPLALVLLAPIGLTLWRRGRQRGSAEDRFAAWFRYGRFHGRLLFALWCTWLFAVLVLDVIAKAGFFLPSVLESGEWMWITLLILLPPALTATVCKMLSAPAFASVPEMGWTRGRLLQQAFWLQFGIVAVGVCLGYSADSQAADPSSSKGVMGFAAAVSLMVICLVGWMQSRQVIQEVLPPGELRERMYELAEQAQVRVRQAFLLPPAPWRLINLLPLIDDQVFLTPVLLSHLSRREVDALLALELARLWRKRQFHLGRFLALFLAALVFIVSIGVWVIFVSKVIPWAIYLIPGVSVMVLRLRSRRRFASYWDREALAITGDPEALITMLAKLRRLQLLPLVTGKEASAADESSLFGWPRLQKLAERARIPPPRLREILARPGSGEDRFNPLPTAPGIATEDSRIFSRAFKRRSLWRQTWMAAALEVAGPVVIAYAVQTWHWQGVWLIAAYLLGLPLAVLLRRFGLYQVVVRNSLILRRGIRGNLENDGLTPETWGGWFVGLSPHAEPRNYENFLVWDLGFLIPAGDQLCYLGDRTRFALDRGSLVETYMGPGPPGWRSAKRLYIVWRDEERDMGGTFNLSLSEARSPWRRAPRTEKLAERLRDWLKQPVASSEVPPPLRHLPGPDFRTVASESLGRMAAVGIFLGLLFLRAPFVLIACFLLGLSFEDRLGAGGWYVVSAVALLQLWTVLSYLRYRGKRGDGDADPDAPRRD